MTADTAAAVPFEPNVATQRRTLLLGTRLTMGANTMLMGGMLFAYIYLRSQNNNGNWRPDGIADLTTPPMAVALLLQLACLGAVLATLTAVRRGQAARMLGVVALVLGFAGAGAHVWYQYNLGGNWVINNGTYTAVTEMWFGILIVELGLAWLWLLSIVVPGPRASDTGAVERHLRAFAEFWAYMVVASTFVFLLARFVE
jgi:heme/copper-type cytochrome/quinol oxidase subunit 3